MCLLNALNAASKRAYEGRVTSKSLSVFDAPPVQPNEPPHHTFVVGFTR